MRAVVHNKVSVGGRVIDQGIEAGGMIHSYTLLSFKFSNFKLCTVNATLTESIIYVIPCYVCKRHNWTFVCLIYLNVT